MSQVVEAPRSKSLVLAIRRSMISSLISFARQCPHGLDLRELVGEWCLVAGSGGEAREPYQVSAGSWLASRLKHCKVLKTVS